MMKARKTLAIVLSLLFIFVMLFSHLFILAEADHDCSGEDCPICQIIAIVRETLKGFSLSVCLFAVAALAPLAAKKAVCNLCGKLFHSTPVLLKVKLSN